MIAKEDKFRKAFISRYKPGKIVVFDYKSFETRLSMYISRDEEFILSNINSDLHLNTAKKIFSTDTISDKQREVAKSINHSILYGGGDTLIKNILTEAKVEDVEKILLVIKEYLSPIFDVSNYINGVYKELGYIINPFGTIIRPNKTYAAFNNYIQSTAADIVADKLLEIKEYIKDKNISFMFQVYDSFIFDFSEDSLIYIEELKDILSKYNDMRFDIESYIGENYGELRLLQK
jgi:DNA polymerase I-like protein with 3'-5' exonuclease and polymerase domains